MRKNIKCDICAYRVVCCEEGEKLSERLRNYVSKVCLNKCECTFCHLIHKIKTNYSKDLSECGLCQSFETSLNVMINKADGKPNGSIKYNGYPLYFCPVCGMEL